MLSDKIRFHGERLIRKWGFLLFPFSFLYALIVYLRNALYDYGFLRVEKAPCVVVSVGNIVAGGSGKTPFVRMLAERFSHRKVAILSRGYGAMPDEALLLKAKLPQVGVFVGKDRAKLSQLVKADLIILDDGLQHRRLHRDFEIILGEKKGHYLPWGFLRDTPRRKHDAWFQEELELQVERVVDFEGREVSLKGKKVGVVCGIAKPERFCKTIESLGATIAARHFVADHEKADLSRLDPALVWVCTEKDRVKFASSPMTLYTVEIKMHCRGELFEKLVEKIEGAINNKQLL